MAHTHFIGMRGDQTANAEKIWGKADFTHMWHDHRMWGDIDTDNDTLIFGSKGRETASKYSWQDHELH